MTQALGISERIHSLKRESQRSRRIYYLDLMINLPSTLAVLVRAVKPTRPGRLYNTVDLRAGVSGAEALCL